MANILVIGKQLQSGPKLKNLLGGTHSYAETQYIGEFVNVMGDPGFVPSVIIFHGNIASWGEESLEQALSLIDEHLIKKTVLVSSGPYVQKVFMSRLGSWCIIDPNRVPDPHIKAKIDKILAS